MPVEWDTVNGGTIETIDQSGRQWRSTDMMATEYEVSKFIGQLVRTIKPLHLVETGCYIGQTTSEIVWALRDNDFGFLWTCDTDLGLVNDLREKLSNPRLAVFHQDGESLCASLPDVDFAFLDSGGDRVKEALALTKALSPGAIVLLHDSRRPAKDEIKRLTGWQMIEFNTPRGLAMFQVS